MPRSQRSWSAPLKAMKPATFSWGRISICSARIPSTTESATSSGSSSPPEFRAAAPIGSSIASSSIGVRTPCGQMQDTLTPRSTYSIAIHSASATAACLVTL